MRLTDDQIKQGIIHPEQLVRDVAVRYFSESFSSDPTVMPLVIQAIETYGWENNLSRFSLRTASLAQTDATLLWVIDQLSRIGRPETFKDTERFVWMFAIIINTAPALLIKHEQEIVRLKGFSGHRLELLAERLRLPKIGTDSCWNELEAFCEDNDHDKLNISDVALRHGERLAEAIARDETCAERVLSLLSHKHPLAWMEGLAIHMAGLMRLDAAVPMLGAKLMADGGDYINEECLYAFQKIGTNVMVDTICKDFHAAPWHYRFYVSLALGGIHTDLAVSKCQELLKQEETPPIPLNLMAAVLGSFCLEGIEPVRRWTLQGVHDLRKELLGVAILMGVLFPELETLKEDARKHDQEIAQRQDLLTNGPKRKPPAPSFDHLLAPPPQSPIAKKSQVGRNEPCPCGSGKKYKKCCGRDK